MRTTLIATLSVCFTLAFAQQAKRPMRSSDVLALRSQGIPTGLVLYPSQYHGISVPSYQKDRYDRYMEWFDKYLKGIQPVKVNREIK